MMTTENERQDRLLKAARAWMGVPQPGLARAPGRVNVIGEHTDYSGCPVLPVASEHDILGAFCPRADGVVRVRDHLGFFGERQFRVGSLLEPYAPGDFGNYIKAAVQGLAGEGCQVGFDLLLDGNIPPAAGMSSSSALVVLAGLVFSAVNGLADDKLALAGKMALAERYVGTQGGGMDQAASLNGVVGHALKIDFFPLRVTPVPWPESVVLVVADTLVKAPKSEAVRYEFNRRSLECRLAAQVLGVARLGDLPFQPAGNDENSVYRQACRTLKDDQWTAAKLGVADLGPEPPDGFKLLSRFQHVYSEWRRVEAAAAALRGADTATLGALMNDSHFSCRDLHQVSCPELDDLSALARDSGAWGSRMTGAGFGGCTVSLVPSERVEEFTRRLKQGYYRGRVVDREPVFVVRPSAGASVLVPFAF